MEQESMATITVLSILLTHFVADFIFQTDKQATSKSSSNYWLTMHAISYSAGLAIFALLCISGFIVNIN